MPLHVMEKSLMREVTLLLKDGRMLTGKLTGYDEYMNMVLENSEETKDGHTRRLGVTVLRGNNIVSISPK